MYVVSEPPDPVTGLAPMVVDAGGSGPAVVLLHGQPGDRHDWELVLQGLGEQVFSLAPDRPGYGRTGGRAGGIAANAEAVVELLDRYGIARATLVGHSWGGAVALEVAGRHPERVTALVLVASVGGPGSIDDLDRVLGTRVVGPLLSLAGVVAMRVGRARRRPAPTGARLSMTGVRGAWRSFVTEQRALLYELPGVTARLREIDVEAVVILGGADRVVRPEAQEELAARLPRAEVVRLSGRGHLLPREAPGVVAEVILRMAGAGPDLG